MDEVDVEPVDLGRELRQSVQLLLDPAPVVLVRPVARHLLQQRKLHALRRIGDEFVVGPARLRDATPKIGQPLVAKLDVERTDVDRVPNGGSHVSSLRMIVESCLMQRSTRGRAGLFLRSYSSFAGGGSV